MEFGEDRRDFWHDLLSVLHARCRRLDGRHDLLFKLLLGLVLAHHLLEGPYELKQQSDGLGDE